MTDGIRISINDPMLAAIFGGALAGFSTGIYLSLGGSVGGLDIIGTVIKKRLAIPIGTVFNIVNLTIKVFAANCLVRLVTLPALNVDASTVPVSSY